MTDQSEHDPTNPGHADPQHPTAGQTQPDPTPPAATSESIAAKIARIVGKARAGRGTPNSPAQSAIPDDRPSRSATRPVRPTDDRRSGGETGGTGAGGDRR